ncbi:MAG: hypothetical protein HXY39_13215 [Chloroflexi bacterium]|nr:hypothetical protein [Chloroflexota bacterium]
MKKIASPGNLALFFCIMVTSLWTFWGVTEMFHEGWYAPFEWMFFLLPASLSLTVTLIALTWPRLGGWLLIGTGIAFYTWVLVKAATGFGLNLQIILSWFPASGFLACIGVLFLLEARRPSVTSGPDPRWWWRNLRYLLAVGIPLLLGLGLASKQAIHLAHRVDDGNYGTRLIPGNGVSLVWAPAGPGWGRSVTWNQVALYGLPPPGFDHKSFGHEGRCNKDTSEGCATALDMQRYNVCLYLSEDGSRLEPSFQGDWRMPTTDEIVRSLVRHGENAGCIWEGQTGNQPCTVTPDKETPLWNPKSPIIYLWSADEANRDEAYYVTYHGAVWAGSKFVGLGSRGYRCVR